MTDLARVGAPDWPFRIGITVGFLVEIQFPTAVSKFCGDEVVPGLAFVTVQTDKPSH